MTPWTVACQASLSFPIPWSLLKLLSIESVMPSNHLVLCCPLLLLPLTFSSIRVFLMSQLFESGGQNIGTPTSASVFPMNIQGWFPLESTGWISLQSKGLQHHISKASILHYSAFFMVQLSHPFMTTGKTIALTRQTFVSKVTSLLFNTLFRFVTTFFQGSSIFNFIAAVTICSDFGATENKVCHCFHVSPSICHELMGTRYHDLSFWMLSFKSAFSLSSFTFIKGLFSSYSLYSLRVMSSAYMRLFIFLLATLIPACASSSPAFLMMYPAY